MNTFEIQTWKIQMKINANKVALNVKKSIFACISQCQGEIIFVWYQKYIQFIFMNYTISLLQNKSLIYKISEFLRSAIIFFRKSKKEELNSCLVS